LVKPDTLPQESLVSLVINGAPFTHILCTPFRIKELVIGWLFTQHIIDGPDDIISLGVCDDLSEANVRLKKNISPATRNIQTVTTSGCSGGSAVLDVYLKDTKKVNSRLTIEKKQLPKIISAMYRQVSLESQSGGIHCAGLVRFDESFDTILTTNDIGRHNAVDKVIGLGLLKEFDFANSVIATSGRISSDMTFKAARAGIPVIISQRSVTSMAADIARATAIAVVGRLSKPDQIIAGNVKRITG